MFDVEPVIMTSFAIFNEFSQELFSRKKAVFTEDLSCLSGKRVGFDVRTIVYLFIEEYTKTPDTNTCMIVEKFLANLREWRIDPVFVLGGVQVRNSILFNEKRDHMFSAYWDLKRRRFEADQQMETGMRKDELKRIRKLHRIVMRSDSKLIEDWIEDGVLVAFEKNNVDYFRAVQLREHQLLSLYEDGLIDAIVGNPIIFLLSDIPNVIKDLNFNQKTFSFYDVATLANGLQCQNDQHFRRFLRFAMCVLDLETRFCKTLNFVGGLEKFRLSDILAKEKAFEDMLYTSFTEHLTIFQNLRTRFDPDGEAIKAEFCKLLDVDVEDFESLLGVAEVSLYISAKAGEIRCSRPASQGSPEVLDVPGDVFCFLFALDMLTTHPFQILCKLPSDTVSVPIGLANCEQYKEIYYGIYKNSLEALLNGCPPIWGLPSVEYRLEGFGSSRAFSFVPRRRGTVQSFYCASSHAMIASCLREFVRKHRSAENYVRFSKASNLSKNGIVEHIFIGFLHATGFINLHSRSVSTLGELLSRFTNTPYIQELIYYIKLTEYRVTFPKLTDAVELEELERLRRECESNSINQALHLNSAELGLSAFRKDLSEFCSIEEARAICIPFSEEENQKIRLISRVFEIATHEKTWGEHLDYDLMQFIVCFNKLRDAFNLLLTSDMLDLVFNTNTCSHLELLDQAKRQLLFKKYAFSGRGIFIKMWIGRYIGYTRCVGKIASVKALLPFIMPAHLMKSMRSEYNAAEYLKQGKGFFDVLSQFFVACLKHPDNPFANQSKEVLQLLEAYELFLEFFSTVIPESDRAPAAPES